MNCIETIYSATPIAVSKIRIILRSENACVFVRNVFMADLFLYSVLGFPTANDNLQFTAVQGRRGRSPTPAFHTLAEDMSLNRGATHFTLGQQPAVIATYFTAIFYCKSRVVNNNYRKRQACGKFVAVNSKRLIHIYDDFSR